MTANTQQIATIGHNGAPVVDIENVRQEMTAKHSEVLQGARDIVTEAQTLPTRIELGDEVGAGKLADFIKRITGTTKNLEAIRVKEKEPYLAAGRAVDGYFKLPLDAMMKAKILAQKPLDDFAKRKADEARRIAREEADRQREESIRLANAAAELEKANLPQQAAATLTEAVIHEAHADKAQQQSVAKASTMTQTRGEMGSVSSLRTRWVGEVVDRDNLDLENLRHHIHSEALQRALNSFVQAGGRNLRGASIYEKQEVVVR